jgi:hypothetical protein
MYHDQSFDTDLPGCFKRIFEIISGGYLHRVQRQTQPAGGCVVFFRREWRRASDLLAPEHSDLR